MRGVGGEAGSARVPVPSVPAVRCSAGACSSAVFVPVFRPPAPPLGRHHCPPPGAMAAAAGDGAVKPLQCAMKLANGAIELDTGNQPRVRRGEAGTAPDLGQPGGRGRGRGRRGGRPPGPLRRLRGAGLGSRLVTLDSSQPSLSLPVCSANRELEPRAYL